jgi:branched-subunit amino acid transport protein
VRHVGPAVLAALVASIAAVGPDGTTGVGVAEVGALAVTAIVARWRSNLLVGLIAGMITLWLCMALI